MGVGGNANAPASVPPGETRYPLQRGLLGPRTVDESAENLATTGNHPACSESLYRQHYPGARIMGLCVNDALERKLKVTWP
jgi:hypothetical protein